MEMRAVGEIGMAEDLSPPLPPLAFCLHDSFLSTLCSACSLPLPDSPFSPALPPDSVHHHCCLLYYCSSRCCSLDSPLHFSSSEHNLVCQSPSSHDSSNTRLSLRLLSHFSGDRAGTVNLNRIGGLVTNYERLVVGEGNEDIGNEVLGMIKEGATRMLLAGNFGDDMAAVAEAVMCLVVTNAVEVQDKYGRNVGVAVYDTAFSWINHSCSPNACYRFTEMLTGMEYNTQLRMYPAAMDCGGGDDDGATAGPAIYSKRTGSEGCGPRIIVRSIKEIRKDEEVTISYTDLLQPKRLRHRELVTKYQFSCCCKRCRATPATYVDHALQAIFVCSPAGQNLISDYDFYESNEAQELIDVFDNALDEYLTFNNPETCCTKLEDLLTHGYPNLRLEPKLGPSRSCIRLHQLHHLSLNAYITLASAYRVRASDLMALAPENDKHLVESFNMSRISAAYSLLLAVFTHHLFLQESSLIASVANYWRSAGESLVIAFQKLHASISKKWLCRSQKCYQVVQPDIFAKKSVTSELFAARSGKFLNCTAHLAESVWNFLMEEGCHLNEIKDLVYFRGLLAVEPPRNSETHLICNCYSTVPPEFEANEHNSQASLHLFHLGVHCLIYGAYLSFLCFDKHSQLLDSDVVNFLYSEGILSGLELKL